jgi:predicted NUDIX family phosphoesterase
VNENVLVVQTAGINPMLTGAFTPTKLQQCLDFILANHSFRSRAIVEEDNSFKQIIPYVLVRHDSRYLLTRRTNRQTEKRLHGKYSIGIGGHINDTETLASGKNVLEAGLERELEEEIHVHGPRKSLELAGMISDETTPVGEVHLGLVFLLQTGSGDFTVNEPDLMTAEWANVDTVRAVSQQMETWSQIALENVVLATEVGAHRS